MAALAQVAAGDDAARLLDAMRRPLRSEQPAQGFLTESAPGRAEGALEIREDLRFVVGRRDLAPGAEAGFSAEIPRSRSLDLYDAGLAWDALRLGDRAPLTLSVTGGVRARWDEARGDLAIPGEGSPTGRRTETSIAGAPTAGLGLRWDLARGVFLRGTGSWRVDDSGGGVAGVGAEAGLDLTGAVGLSLGFERTSAAMSGRGFDETTQRELVFARLSLRF
jgi:hypothetical protein